MKRLIFCLIISTLTACSSKEPDSNTSYCGGNFVIHEEDFSQEQINDIHISVFRWNAFLGYSYFHVVEQSVCPIYINVIANEHGGECHCTTNIPGGIVIDINKWKYDNWDSGEKFQVVIMHEMGHSLGMKHVNGSGIMANGAATVSQDFTSLDLEECIRVGFCKKEK